MSQQTIEINDSNLTEWKVGEKMFCPVVERDGELYASYLDESVENKKITNGDELLIVLDGKSVQAYFYSLTKLEDGFQSDLKIYEVSSGYKEIS